LRCLVTFFILTSYIIPNGDYIIISSFYLGIDKCSFYIIILSVWIIGLIYLCLFFDESDGIILKIIIFNIIIIVLILFFVYVVVINILIFLN